MQATERLEYIPAATCLSVSLLGTPAKEAREERDGYVFLLRFCLLCPATLRDKRSVRRRASPGADSNRSESFYPPPPKKAASFGGQVFLS